MTHPSISAEQIAFCQRTALQMMTARRKHDLAAWRSTWARVRRDDALAQCTAWIMSLATIDVPHGTRWSAPPHLPLGPVFRGWSQPEQKAEALINAAGLLRFHAQLGLVGAWQQAWPAVRDDESAALQITEAASTLWTDRCGYTPRRAARCARRSVRLAYGHRRQRRAQALARHLRWLMRRDAPHKSWPAPQLTLHRLLEHYADNIVPDFRPSQRSRNTGDAAPDHPDPGCANRAGDVHPT